MNWNWKKIYDQAYNWILIYGPKILLAAVVLIAGFLLIRVLNKWMTTAMKKRHVNPSVRYFLQNLIVLTLKVLLIILALQIVGLELTVVSAIIAGLTVAAGLALSGTLQNFVSGILILILKPYRVGDNINTQGAEGTVTSIQLFYTEVLTFDNRTIIVPNGQLSNSVVINLSREGRRRLDIDLRFPYAIDVDQVRKIIQASIESAKDILPDPQTRIGVSLLDNDRYVLTINVWASAHGFYDTRIAVNEKLMNDIKAAGIKFPGM